MAFIICTKGPSTGQQVEIGQEPVLIGRRKDCAVMIDDVGVSGHHAKLQRQDGRWILADLNSSNGTMVNGNTVQTWSLQHGDMIVFGQTQWRFVDTAGGARGPRPLPPGGDQPRRASP